MNKNYSDCFYCGGEVVERRVPREIRWKGQLLVFEDVPMGVCSQCGEKFLLPEVAKSIDHILQVQMKPAKVIQVPVYEYALQAA